MIRIQDNDANAFKCLFDKYCESLLNFAYLYVKNYDACEDIVQQLWVNVWKRRQSLNPAKSIKAYLLQAAKNQSLKYLRDKKPTETINPMTHQISSANPENELIRQEMLDEIYYTIERLPEKCKEIFIMSRIDRISYAEIAEIQGVSVNTVKTQMGRALKMLRKTLHITLQLFINSINIQFRL